jgi:hypothetical protein
MSAMPRCRPSVVHSTRSVLTKRRNVRNCNAGGWHAWAILSNESCFLASVCVGRRASRGAGQICGKYPNRKVGAPLVSKLFWVVAVDYRHRHRCRGRAYQYNCWRNRGALHDRYDSQSLFLQQVRKSRMPNKGKATAGQWFAAILMILGLAAAIAWRFFWPYPPVYIAMVFAVLLAAGLIAVKLCGGASDDTKRGDKPPNPSGNSD